MGNYRELLAWRKAMQLAESVYRTTEKFPKQELYGLTSQMRRASVSVPSNIAEGQGRGYDGQFVHFLGIARGSLLELETQTNLSCTAWVYERPRQTAPFEDFRRSCSPDKRTFKLFAID